MGYGECTSSWNKRDRLRLSCNLLSVKTGVQVVSKEYVSEIEAVETAG